MSERTYTLLYMRRSIAFYEAEIALLEDSKKMWHKKFASKPRKQIATVRRLQYHIRLAQIDLARWQGMLADWAQS